MRTTPFDDDCSSPRKNGASVAVTRGTSRKVRVSSPAVATAVGTSADIANRTDTKRRRTTDEARE